jgi:DNA (cytosine-5)-methyltransferase 1
MSQELEPIKVVELFAGVGGFRLGLESASEALQKEVATDSTSRLRTYEVVWSNQWEPSSKKQDASDIYVNKWGRENHSNKNIADVGIDDIPDHELLVGGFPCQDYSVARTLNQATGIVGKKGVLWWEIYKILEGKEPNYFFLENVDRLLKSPATQRGRDFAIMLASLKRLKYAVEWRIINAADYGMPQRRRRVFLLGYHQESKLYEHIIGDKLEWALSSGVLAQSMPVNSDQKKLLPFNLSSDMALISEEFNAGGKYSPFKNTGLMINGEVWTVDTTPHHTGKRETLGDIILKNGAVPENYYIVDSSIEKWKYLKGAKDEQRVNRAQGFTYRYNEGPMVFPDPLDKPSRTIVTGEGGSAPSRFKHVIMTEDGRLRRLMPVELERLNMFPDGHTEGVSDVRRAFFMGNALVVGVVERIGKELLKRLSE